MILLSLLSISIVPENIINNSIDFKRVTIILDSVDKLTNVKSVLDLPIFSPIKMKDIIEIKDMYGKRLKHPITRKPSFHTGIDFSVVTGTKIYSTADGIISKAERKGGFGKQIIIQHKDDYSTRYGHLSKIIVKKGDIVKKGQLIGLSGNTGITTGPHLHYEIMHYNVSMNPLLFYFELPTSKNKKHYLEILNELEKFSFQSVGPK
jgi:murein DD-endopeptidase MepM/ murein hydrolase activator NlpD